MATHGAAARYAKALFQLAKEEGNVDEVRGELGALHDALEGNDELRGVLLQPLYPTAERKAVLGALAAQLGASTTLRNFYAFLIDQRRLVRFDAIVEEFERLADGERGVTQAEVRSASALSEEQLARLRDAIAARMGGEVSLSVEVDPNLVGGVVAKVGDLVFDGSLRSQLSQMRASLLQD